jgi:multidrug resistance efflux pump
VAELCDSELVNQNDVVARLRCAAVEAEVFELEARLERLGKERETLLLDPPQLNDNLIRECHDALARYTQLASSLDALLPARETVIRQLTVERLSRLEDTARVDTELDALASDLQGARVRLLYAQRHVSREAKLAEKGVISSMELDLRKEQFEQAKLEIDRLQQQFRKLNAEKAQYADSLQDLQTLLVKQEGELGIELDRVRGELARVSGELRDVKHRLAQDMQRAQSAHEGQIEQIELEIEEVRQELQGVRETLLVRAPFSGSVVYRDTSPGTAAEKEPVLILGQRQGFLVRMRLRRAQIAALERVSAVTFRLTEPSVVPYFQASFVRATPLAEKPSYAVAELACTPPQEIMKDLIDGERITAEALWRPPMHTLLLFQTGCITLLAGAVLWGVATFLTWRRQGATPQRRETCSAAGVDLNRRVLNTSAVPGGSMLQLESGAVASMLELLGSQLREALLRRDVGDDLNAALEWSLDRHQTRAIRCLRAGLGMDEELEPEIERLVQDLQRLRAGNGRSAGAAQRLERTLRVFQALHPEITCSGRVL